MMLSKLNKSPDEHVRGKSFPQDYLDHMLIEINDRPSSSVC